STTDRVTLSPMASQIFGVPAGANITWREMQARLLHSEDAPKAAEAVAAATHGRSAYRTEYRITRPPDERQAWVRATGKARYDGAGSLIGMIGLVEDITESKREHLATKEEAQALDILNRTGSIVASELDLEKVVQAVTDAGVQITGAQFGAFFYNVIG